VLIFKFNPISFRMILACRPVSLAVHARPFCAAPFGRHASPLPLLDRFGHAPCPRHTSKKRKPETGTPTPPIIMFPTDKIQTPFCKNFLSGLPPLALGRRPTKANESRGDGAFVPTTDKSSLRQSRRRRKPGETPKGQKGGRPLIF
jgi:hypothetical protein